MSDAIVERLSVAHGRDLKAAIEGCYDSDPIFGDARREIEQLRATLAKAITYIEEFHALDGARAEDLALVAELRAVLPAGSKTTCWRPIDTAPKDGRQILTALHGNRIKVWWQQTTFWRNDGGGWNGFPAGVVPQFWRPLPEPPSEIG